MRAFLVFLLSAAGMLFGTPTIKYCGHLLITGIDNPQPHMYPPFVMGALVGLYISPTGMEPMPPKTCVWVFFDTKRGDKYIPTIVVWSDTQSGYHADIYSDPAFIFGHRQNEPSDYEPHGIPVRNKEMENYLNAAAGSHVLERVLKALKRGDKEVSFDWVIDAPIPTSPGVIPRLRVKYYLYDISRDPNVPLFVRTLMERGKNKRIPHTPTWVPIRVPATLVE